MSYETITTTEAADAVLASTEPAWVCKHSVTCPVSSAGFAQFERYLDDHDNEPAALVIIQQSRNVSTHIAEATGVRHESPQVLLVRNHQVLWHVSHGGITAEAMAEAMAQTG